MSDRLQALRAWQARRPFAADAALAVALGLFFALSADDTAIGGWLLIAALTAPLAWRRRAPLAAFAAIALVAFAQWLASEPLLADSALLLALYSVAAHARRGWGLPAAFAVAEVGALLAALRFSDGVLLPFASVSAFVVAAVALGVYVRTRREHIAALLLRAQELERERDQQAQLATATERTRIARELHDVVAHHLTVMVTLTEGARLTAEQAPGEAAAAMRDVAATGRTALGEMRRLLGVLGEQAEDGAIAAPPLQPQPGIDQLDALVAQVAGAGLPTRLIRTGRPAPLSSGAQLTVYRVVQEALTNALKHARSPSLAEVRLDWAEGALTVEVVNDGARVDPASMNDGAASGRGLTGMRERAAAHGAAVEAGPRSPGGWGVRARLRLDEAADR